MRTAAFAFVAFSFLFLVACVSLAFAFIVYGMVVPAVVALWVGITYFIIYWIVFMVPSRRS